MGDIFNSEISGYLRMPAGRERPPKRNTAIVRSMGARYNHKRPDGLAQPPGEQSRERNDYGNGQRSKLVGKGRVGGTVPKLAAGIAAVQLQIMPRAAAGGITMTPTQLVQLVGEYRGELPPGQWVAQQKHDGWRMAWFRGIDGKPRLWTRNGLPIEGVRHIAARCLAMEEATGEALFIDGEFQVDQTLLATKAWCERAWKLGGCNGTFFAFDCLSFAQWQAGGSDEPWIERQKRLHGLVDATGTLPREPGWVSGATGQPVPERYVQALPGELVGSHAGVVRAAEEVWAAGGEGLVLKRIDSPYRRNRSSDWLKVKLEQKWRMAA